MILLFDVMWRVYYEMLTINMFKGHQEEEGGTEEWQGTN